MLSGNALDGASPKVGQRRPTNEIGKSARPMRPSADTAVRRALLIFRRQEQEHESGVKDDAPRRAHITVRTAVCAACKRMFGRWTPRHCGDGKVCGFGPGRSVAIIQGGSEQSLGHGLQGLVRMSG